MILSKKEKSFACLARKSSNIAIDCPSYPSNHCKPPLEIQMSSQMSLAKSEDNSKASLVFPTPVFPESHRTKGCCDLCLRYIDLRKVIPLEYFNKAKAPSPSVAMSRKDSPFCRRSMVGKDHFSYLAWGFLQRGKHSCLLLYNRLRSIEAYHTSVLCAISRSQVIS